jgi:hypothetical protein
MKRQTVPTGTRSGGAIKVLIDAYVYCSYLAILALLIFRLHWFSLVLNSVQRGYDTTDFESMSEQKLWDGYHLVTGDPSIFCYLAVTVAFLVLVFFGRNKVASNSRRLLIAIRVMIFYSIFMIFAQVVFLDLIAKPSMRNIYQFNTCLRHYTEAAPEGLDVFCVKDPHYVTLAVALLALISLIDRNIVTAVIKLFKGSRPA